MIALGCRRHNYPENKVGVKDSSDDHIDCRWPLKSESKVCLLMRTYRITPSQPDAQV